MKMKKEDSRRGDDRLLLDEDIERIWGRAYPKINSISSEEAKKLSKKSSGRHEGVPIRDEEPSRENFLKGRGVYVLGSDDTLKTGLNPNLGRNG